MAPVLPPLSSIQIVDSQGRLLPAGLNLFQQIWTAAFGSGQVAPNLLGFADAINFNVAKDTQINLILPVGATGWRAAIGMVFGTSGSFTTAKAGIYSNAFEAGTTLVGQTALSAITATGFNVAAVVATLNPNLTAIWTYKTIFLNVGTAQGGPALGNFYLYGYPVF